MICETCQDILRNLPRYFKKGEVDLAIGVGLFDTQTLRLDQGLDILNKVRYILADRGHGIFKSYGVELFNKEHYEKRGFEVITCSNPSYFFTDRRSDIYVIRNRLDKQVNSEITHSLFEESRQWKKYPNLIDKSL